MQAKSENPSGGNCKGRILIVEDEPLCVNLLQTFLENLGYETTSPASCGEEALRIAAEEHPDIALMDVNLGQEMGGLETAKAIYSSWGIGSIFVSGYPKEDVWNATKGEWALGYVGKPFDLDHLEATVNQSILKKRSNFGA